MKRPVTRTLLISLISTGMLSACATQMAEGPPATKRDPIGRTAISTIAFDTGLSLRSATYTPSGKVLVSYAGDHAQDERFITLAVMNDDGSNLRPFFSQRLPDRAKDNGIRYMVFPDNRRIFLGDFIVECMQSLDECVNPVLLPVEYPAQVAGGDAISHRWSEIIVAPDNRTISWTTLLSNYSAMVFIGEIQKQGAGYRIVNTRIVSTLDGMQPDPNHPDGVRPGILRGGEVKQFVGGGTAISMAGAARRDLPDTVVQHLATGDIEAITDTPGYTETTIFSPDEQLGITMSSRFSTTTDPAILGLMPRPYASSLNMGLNMLAYTYAVTGVRRQRSGSIGPVLIDIAASKKQADYSGVNLNTQNDWVFHSPMSWHPGGTKAMWIEGQRSSGAKRMQVVNLPDYRPARPVPAQPTPGNIPYASSDLSIVGQYAKSSHSRDVKVYGRVSGYIHYRRSPDGRIDKTYVDFNDGDGVIYAGNESMAANPRGRSTYKADVKVTGAKRGIMDLQMTFGPLNGDLPAQLVFARDASGAPLTRGYVEYDGRRLQADTLVP